MEVVKSLNLRISLLDARIEVFIGAAMAGNSSALRQNRALVCHGASFGTCGVDVSGHGKLIFASKFNFNS